MTTIHNVDIDNGEEISTEELNEITLLLNEEISNESLDISVEGLFDVNKEKLFEKLANILAKATSFTFKESGNIHSQTKEDVIADVEAIFNGEKIGYWDDIEDDYKNRINDIVNEIKDNISKQEKINGIAKKVTIAVAISLIATLVWNKYKKHKKEKEKNKPSIEELDTFSNEDFFDLSKMTGFFTGFISKFTNFFTNKELIPISTSKHEIEKSRILVEKYSKLQLENFKVIIPEFLDTKMLPYLEMLLKSISELNDVEKDLLIPLDQWVAHMLTDPSYGEKLWVNTVLDYDRVHKLEANKAKLNEYFNAAKGDHTSERPFYEVYGSVKELVECSNEIEKLSALTMKFLDGKLTAMVENLSKNLSRLDKKEDVANNLSNINTDKIKPITELVLQAAKELEFLSIILFQIKSVSFCQEETISRINSQLK